MLIASAADGDPGYGLGVGTEPRGSGRPVCSRISLRAAALLDGDHERLLTTAAAFETAGCPYQRARTLILASGETAPVGNAALAWHATGGKVLPAGRAILPA